MDGRKAPGMGVDYGLFGYGGILVLIHKIRITDGYSPSPIKKKHPNKGRGRKNNTQTIGMAVLNFLYYIILRYVF